MMVFILIFLLFLLQFFYFPAGKSFFEGSKVYAAEISIFLLLLLRLFSKGGLAMKTYKKSFLVCVGVLVLLTVYHLVFHQTQTVLFGNPFRLQGTLLLWMLMLFAILSSKIIIEHKIKPIFLFFVIFVQLICTVLFIGVGSDRPVGTLGEPNALAASMVFVWPFLLFAWPKKLPLRIVTVISMLLAFAIIFLSGSRSGIIALAIQASFLGVMKLQRSVKLAVIIALVLLVASYITPFIGPKTEYEDRGEVWKAAVVAGLDHPIVGVGFGNAEYSLHTANVKLHNKLVGYYVDSSHNIFLDWIVQAGVVGLGILLFLLYQSFKSFINKEQIRGIVLLLGLITALSFNPASVVSLIALWWLLGQGTSKV
jgi:O-antigen ligase